MEYQSDNPTIIKRILLSLNILEVFRCYRLNWAEIHHGYKLGFVTKQDIIDEAGNQVTIDTHEDSPLFQLSIMNPNEDIDQNLALLAKSSGFDRDPNEIWIFLAIRDTYLKRDQLEDPLQTLEEIVAWADYPSALLNLLRFMPMADNDSREPSISSIEENWKRYVDSQELLLNCRSSDLI